MYSLMEVQWTDLSIHLIKQLFFSFTQSKLASMSNDFKSVLEVRTEVRNFGGFLLINPKHGKCLKCELSLGSFVHVLQNLKQQRSRREQFSQPPVSSSPLMANNFSKFVGTSASGILQTVIFPRVSCEALGPEGKRSMLLKRVCSLCFSG